MSQYVFPSLGSRALRGRVEAPKFLTQHLLCREADGVKGAGVDECDHIGLFFSRSVEQHLSLEIHGHLSGAWCQSFDESVESADHRNERHRVVLDELIVLFGTGQTCSLARGGKSCPSERIGQIHLTSFVAALCFVCLRVEQFA
jgi:hypothetical protein